MFFLSPVCLSKLTCSSHLSLYAPISQIGIALAAFLLLWYITLMTAAQLRRGALFGSQLQGTVHKEDTVAGAEASRWHCKWIRKGRQGGWCSAHFPFQNHRIPLREMVPPTVCKCSHLIEPNQDNPHRHVQRPVSEAILDLIRLLGISVSHKYIDTHTHKDYGEGLSMVCEGKNDMRSSELSSRPSWTGRG